MKKNYTRPEISIKRFASENIVTLSNAAFNSVTYKKAVESLTTNSGVTDKTNIFSFNV